MVDPRDLARIQEYGQSHPRKHGVMLRGYKNDSRGGLFTPAKIRELSQYLLLLADRAEEMDEKESEDG